MKVIISVVILVPSALLTAFVVATMWGWFVVPLGAPHLGMAHAYGLGTLISYVAMARPKPDTDSPWWQTLANAVGQHLAASGYALGAGWIALQFMQGGGL